MGTPKIQPNQQGLRSLGKGTVSFDRAVFDQKYSQRPFRVRHDLANHPLFEIERLAKLAESLPSRRVEWNSGNLPVSVAPNTTPSNGLSAVETLHNIHRCESWIVLKHVQLDPDYDALLSECLRSFEPALHARGIKMLRPCGFIFASSPGATTPCHLDPESNFLLQVRGSKTLSALERNDESVVGQHDLERFTAGGDRNVELSEEARRRAIPFEIHPGDGVHVPLHSPHFVENGPEVSVSFSVTFQTEITDRERGVLWMNHRLRALGLQPNPPGASESSDRAKLALFRGLRGVRRLLRGES